MTSSVALVSKGIKDLALSSRRGFSHFGEAVGRYQICIAAVHSHLGPAWTDGASAGRDGRSCAVTEPCETRIRPLNRGIAVRLG